MRVIPISLIHALRSGRWIYEWRYLWGRTPWESGKTPPEVTAFVENTGPGKALDLGCGAGTHAIYLARHGWRVTGIDYAYAAIFQARRKAARAGLQIDFLMADVTDADFHPGAYDYVLDIGCLFSLKAEKRAFYAKAMSEWVRPGGVYMLFSWLPKQKKGRIVGLSTEAVRRLFDDRFLHIRTAVGEAKRHPCAWYWFKRRNGIVPDFIALP